MQSDNNNANNANNNNDNAVPHSFVQGADAPLPAVGAPIEQTNAPSGSDASDGVVADALGRAANAMPTDNGAHTDGATPLSDTEDGDGDEDDGDSEAISIGKDVGASSSTVSSSSSSSFVNTTAATSSDVLSNTPSRKRPLELSQSAILKQQQQQVRKRRYVDSSHTVDGVRKHVTVACARVETGGFKCTFTLEHRRLEGTLNQQRANAKGGDIIERRHDVFMIQDPLGDDAPFPDYDRVYDNFLKRGIDICDHVRSELVPIRAVSCPATAPKEPAPAAADAAEDATNATNDAAS
nr:hypothetical protein [Pandoravirus massiliensis]